MGYHTPDLYGQPEDFGLTILGELDNGGGYDYDYFVVWRDADGNVYWATDSGCSCSSPFEYHTSLEDATKGSAAECERALITYAAESYRSISAASVHELRDKLAAL